MDLNDKIYFSFYVKENVIIFDLYEYIGKLGADVVDYFSEWNLLKDKKIIFKRKTIKDFILNKIKNEINPILEKTKKLNCKFLFIFLEKNIYEQWMDYFDDNVVFIDLCKKIFKKNYKNFFETKTDTLNLNNKNGYFYDIPCFLPSGEEEEFLMFFIKKSK